MSAIVDNVEALSQLATVALTSSDKVARENAARQLLFLNSFDHWDVVKHMLPKCMSNNLRFIVCKAILFIVSNELGTEERMEMQTFVLDYLRNCRGEQIDLPRFVRNELYSIYASAMYTNWKAIILSTKDSEQEDLTEYACQIIEQLKAYLDAEGILDCLMEVIVYFSRQNDKVSILPVRMGYERQILPYFFFVAAGFLESLPTQAAEVCATVLEHVSRSTDVPVDQWRTSDAGILLAPWDAWSMSIHLVVDYCSYVIEQDPYGPKRDSVGRLLCLCSTITSYREPYNSTRRALSDRFLALSETLLKAYHSNQQEVGLLLIGCTLLTHTFEFDTNAFVAYFRANTYAIDAWAAVTHSVVARWGDDEDELRRQLMHLIYFIGDALLPVPSRGHDRRGRSPFFADAEIVQIMGDGAEESNSIRREAGVEGGADGLFSPERNQEVLGLVSDIFMVYFNSVVVKAHLQEDSQELRSESGIILHNERTLLPLSELLCCPRVDFLPIVVERLKNTIEQYRACARAREEELSLSSTTGLESYSSLVGLVQELTLALETDGTAHGTRALNQCTPQELMRVCLSRLSVIISIIAIAFVNESTRHDAGAMQLIAAFARQLLSQDDELTNSLLQCLSLGDDNTTTARQGGSGMGVHQGVLRSLFFFCGCVYESEFAREPEFYKITLGLLRFVYLYHSDKACLMMDASALLQRMVSQGISSTQFIVSDHLLAVMQAVKEDTMIGLAFTSSSDCVLTETQQQARAAFLRAFTMLVETRYYVGYTVVDVIPTFVGRALSQERLSTNPRLALMDLIAVTEGCCQPAAMHWVLAGLMESKSNLLQAAEANWHCAPLVIRLFARVCSLTRRLLERDNISRTPWELASMVVNVLSTYFGYLGFHPDGGLQPLDEQQNEGLAEPGSLRRQHAFRSTPAGGDATVIYDLAAIVESMCGASWCNMGVVMQYERTAVEFFFCRAMNLLCTVPVELLMSNENGRRDVFMSMTTALSLCTTAFYSLNVLFMRQGLWQTLLQYLTGCISYAATVEVLQLMYEVTKADAQCRNNIPNYNSIDSHTLGAAYREVAVLIAIAPKLGMREMDFCFGILQYCYSCAPVACIDRTDHLLDSCSAYHRVRLRLIMTLLRQSRPDVMEAYVSLFGHSSKVGVLSAW